MLGSLITSIDGRDWRMFFTAEERKILSHINSQLEAYSNQGLLQ